MVRVLVCSVDSPEQIILVLVVKETLPEIVDLAKVHVLALGDQVVLVQPFRQLLGDFSLPEIG